VVIEKLQIVNWKNYLKFPDEARLSPEAKDMICRLLCDVDHRLGGRGGDDIKVSETVDLICIVPTYCVQKISLQF
jgi:hypothetical protein